jgi:hypothetical protein
VVAPEIGTINARATLLTNTRTKDLAEGCEPLPVYRPRIRVKEIVGRGSRAVGPPGPWQAPGPTAQPLLLPCLNSRSS